MKLIGKGLRTNQVRESLLTPEQLATLSASPEHPAFDGDPQRFRLGIEAHRLGLAYEYDPFFSLSIARVDPLPHQLEAFYEYFLKLPRPRDQSTAERLRSAARMIASSSSSTANGSTGGDAESS